MSGTGSTAKQKKRENVVPCEKMSQSTVIISREFSPTSQIELGHANFFLPCVLSPFALFFGENFPLRESGNLVCGERKWKMENAINIDILGGPCTYLYVYVLLIRRGEWQNR